MLKQSENKAQKVSDSVTVSGKKYHRSDFEDAAHPGFTRPGLLFSSAELQACGVMGLTAPSGFSFAAHLPVQSKPDPTHVSRADAPAKLLEAASAAWLKLEEIRARIAAALERRVQAEDAQRRAARQQIKGDYNRAVAAAMKAVEEWQALSLEEAPPRKAAADAEEAVCRWMRDETLYRTGAAQRPEAASVTF